MGALSPIGVSGKIPEVEVQLTPAGETLFKPVTPAPEPEGDKSQGLAHQNLVREARVWSEALVDDQLELKQDADRNAKNVFARMPPLPIGTPVAVAENLAKADHAGRAIPKNPIADKRLSQFGHKGGETSVKKRKLVFLGGPPEQKVLHRPSGAWSGAVTVK